jgi:hypothetical protein
MLSPGYAYERAPDQKHFLNRQKAKTLFRDMIRLGKGKRWRFTQSPLFLDFLAGSQSYLCTPWGKPTRTVFGWQRPSPKNRNVLDCYRGRFVATWFGRPLESMLNS